MLEKRHIDRLREELDSCRRPIFFFHDDADGLCSFLLFYKHVNTGKGAIVKMTPRIDRANYTRKVKEYEPDKVFILDIAVVEQDFLDDMKEMGIPVVWVDHHNPLKRDHVMYFNPRLQDIKDSTCVTSICYHTVRENLWIGMVGSIGDWQMPDFAAEFSEKHPDLLDGSVTRPEEALFSQPIGTLVRIFSFVLKGKTDDVMKCMKILTRIDDPYEILNQTSPPGRFLYRKYESLNEHYEALLRKAREKVTKEELFIYLYKGAKFSFSSELSNELLYHYPSKIILVGREKSGDVKYSIRASEKTVSDALKKALEGVSGFGGGHEHACGAVIKEKFNKRFIKQFRKALGLKEEASG